MIDENRLTAEVNSAERATTLRREIDNRLGDGGRFNVDEIQDLDAMLSKRDAGTSERASSKEHEELMQHPEVQAQVAQIRGKHWETWADHGIPALGGQSPRDAVENPDGREAVEALLKDTSAV
ncbi:MAG: hypothetical protein WAK95_14855 [Desulfobacterales bacterium]